MMIATYTCNRGHNLTGDATRTCQANGMWSGSVPACNRTFKHTSQSLVFMNPFFPLVINCGPLSGPDNGLVTITVDDFGRKGSYSCDTGYLLTEDVIRVCEVNGDWSGTAPTCDRKLNYMALYCFMILFLYTVAVDCGSLDAPSNGAVDTSSGTTFMMTATYTCNTGYTLTGDTTRMCGAGGSWTLMEPTCVGMCNRLLSWPK